MHETSIVAEVIKIVLAKAREYKISKVNAITAKVGELTGVSPEALSFAFEVFSKGTIAAEAEFKLNTVKASAKCETCEVIFAINHVNKKCPVCHRFCNNILTGYELLIETIEGE